MKIGIALFSYNRSKHLQQVLHGLECNNDINRLYLFQDGLKYKAHKKEWEKCKKIIMDFSWNQKKCYFSDQNKGLSRSIVEGIDVVLKENDAVIVLEDDCVPTRNYLTFMHQCLEKYKKNKKVYSVSGYSWPMELKRKKIDVYACGRFCSWGWGTWKDRWEEYTVDHGILRRLYEDRVKSYNLAVWGNDTEVMLLDANSYKNDSWAVYWGLHIIEQEGICVNPYDSYIRNIGYDGTGVHCDETNAFDVETNDIKDNFELSDKIMILDDTKKAFSEIYGSYTAINQAEEKEKVLVYGAGNFFKKNEKEINERYYITAFVDRKRHGWFAGKKVIEACAISEYLYSKILIMVENIDEVIMIAKKIISQGIDYKRIVLGISLYGELSMKEIGVLEDGTLSVKNDNFTVRIRNKSDLKNVLEVFDNHMYDYFINNIKKDVIIDIGIGIGVSTLFFLNSEKVLKVYGYEEQKQDYLVARENIKHYLTDQDRVEIHPYVSKKEGINKDILPGESRNLCQEIITIIQRHADCNIILRLDVKDEREVVETLALNHMLEKISLIILKSYYEDNVEVISILKKRNFSFTATHKMGDVNVTFAYQKIMDL